MLHRDKWQNLLWLTFAGCIVCINVAGAHAQTGTYTTYVSETIVASLWRTEDRATAVLMNRFYENMLGGSGMSPAAALRKAQLSMWQDKRWSQPRYWAAFTIQGEWK